MTTGLNISDKLGSELGRKLKSTLRGKLISWKRRRSETRRRRQRRSRNVRRKRRRRKRRRRWEIERIAGVVNDVFTGRRSGEGGRGRGRRKGHRRRVGETTTTSTESRDFLLAR